MFAGAYKFVIIQTVAGVFFFSRKKQKPSDNEEDPYKNRLTCRFVLDGAGRKIGESVAVDDDILIIKSGKTYLGVPLKHIGEEEKTLLVKGLVDRDKAQELGEKWRIESLCKQDNAGERSDGF